MKQKSKKLIILFIISLIMILGFATIVKADGEFKLSKDSEDVELNRTKYLYCENKPTGETITWSSSNNDIASVDSNGQVTAKAIGTATITATAGSQTATCIINVVYSSYVKSNITDVVLVLGEYESKTITITATDYNHKDITNPEVQWKSSDESIARVDSNGKITAVKAGTATITATVAGGTKDIDVTVTDAPTFTDFSKAEYELVKDGVSRVNLHIKNVTNNSDRLYYCITAQNQKPEIKLKDNGNIDTSDSKWKTFGYNEKDGYLYASQLEEYVQLNQDLYLWIIDQEKFETNYYDDNGNSIGYKTQYVVSGQKLERLKYPGYAETFTSSTFMTHDSTQIIYTIPYAQQTERKFTLKIGKITDKNILNGIKNNNGDAWNSLLKYAKNNNAVYNNKLTTNKTSSFAEYGTNFGENRDVIQLKNLENSAYYYMYVVFDDENGKYYPVSGLTLAKASVHNNGDWYLFFLGNDDFKWDDFGVVQTGTTTVDGKTTGTTTKENTKKSSSPSKLPYTGATTIGLTIVVITGFAVFFKVKNNKYKGI